MKEENKQKVFAIIVAVIATVIGLISAFGSGSGSRSRDAESGRSILIFIGVVILFYVLNSIEKKSKQEDCSKIKVWLKVIASIVVFFLVILLVTSSFAVNYAIYNIFLALCIFGIGYLVYRFLKS